MIPQRADENQYSQKDIALVGVSDQGAHQVLLPKAKAFCEALGLKLFMAQVYDDSMILGGYLTSSEFYYDRYSFMEHATFTWMRQGLKQTYLTRLESLAQTYLNRSITALDSIEFGHPASALKQRAKDVGARFMICGAPNPSSRWWFGYDDVSKYLVKDQQLPVLMLPEEAQFDPKGQPLNILLLDDLQPKTSELLEEALSFSKFFNNPNVTHVHIKRVDHPLVRRLKEALHMTSYTHDFPDNDSFRTSLQMRNRASELRESVLNNGGAYKQLILSSHNLKQDLADICSREDATIMFSQLGIKRGDFHTLLQARIPIIFVPTGSP